MKFVHKIMKIGIFLLAVLVAILLYTGKVQAATISSDINGIDEAKYPGYKDKIKQLQTIYPKIKVLYTKLDWETVIRNERVHGRNLVPNNYSEEWRCPDCGSKLYDTGWYCASEEAIKYLMDPRLYLDAKNIFQFQKLDTSAGTLDTKAIHIAAQNSFLTEDWDNIVALYNAARDNNINAFHLVTRTIQEQGSSGTSTLSSGEEYLGTNGVVYKGLYNLFSIGATGNSPAEVKTNGLARALRENWTSRSLSIAGGGTFIKDKYLNVGQNTLYLQKFDVDDSYSGLYWHQYMQNLLAAKNEASLMYDAYNRAKLLLNRDFEFVIPIYENMPATLSQEPNPEYYGNINTDLKTMQIGKEADGRSYITGEVLIAEWVNGVACVPKTIPEMTIKSTDRSIVQGINVTHNGGLSYSYYRILDTLDTNKEYYLEAKLTTDKNISTNKTQNVNMPNMTVGEYKGTTIKTKNNKIYFSTGGYIGDINTDLKEIKLNQNAQGRYYISGNMLVAEWKNNVAYVPNSLPELVLKATDGSRNIPMYISHLQGLNYYYDVFIDGIDLSKQYYIEATLTGEDNIGNRKTQTVLLPNKEIGTFKGRTLLLEDNKIKPVYVGNINTDLKTINLAQNEVGRHYIYGEILIAEWINGVANVPEGLPEMIIKATDGSFWTGIHLVHNGGLSYTYDRVVDNLDVTKEYEIEVKLAGINNKGNSKAQIAKLPNKEIGKYDQVKLIAENNKIKMIDGSLYKGDINTDLQTMYIGINEVGKEYLHGNILIAEWVDGMANTPNGLPEMTLKATDGSYSMGMYVAHVGGLNYYYDRVIDNLDIKKEYYIEVKLTGNKNIGTNKQQRANLNASRNVGMFKDKNLTIENNKIVFKGNEYRGDINTDLKTIDLAQNEVGRNYIYGEILIAEWINGVANVPNKLPEMIIKATDGSFWTGMHLAHNGGLSYTYDRVMDNLDSSKEYVIEVKLTNGNNISTNTVQIAKLPNKQIGKYNAIKLVAEDNKIKMKDGSKYKGDINTDLKTMHIDFNEIGREYIHGNILIAEWVDGVANIPNGLPEMTLKATDGSYSMGMHVVHEGGLNYYYDRVVYDLDTSKEYYIEVKLTNNNNTSTNKTQQANMQPNEMVGMFKGNSKIVLRNNKMLFETVTTRTFMMEMPEEKNEIKQETEMQEELPIVDSLPNMMEEETEGELIEKPKDEVKEEPEEKEEIEEEELKEKQIEKNN